MTEVTDYDKAVARAAAQAIGGQPRVVEYLGEDGGEPMAVLISVDQPAEGFAAYSTVSLHRAENRAGSRPAERALRLRAVGHPGAHPADRPVRL